MEERFELEDGWVLLVEGGITDDGGFAGGHHGATAGLFFPLGTSDEDIAAARAQLIVDEQARAKLVRHVRVELRRDDVRVVLHDERSSAEQGFVQLHGLPVVGPAGVLIRHGIVGVSDANLDEPDGRISWDTEMQHPWLVAPDGAVTRLPFELGVGPLCVLPDGRYLLPGGDALWRDDFDEPLSALAHDGDIEPLRTGGAPLTPSRLVGAADPSWAPERERDETGWPIEDFPFDTQQARIEGQELVVLLADYALDDWLEESPFIDEPEVRWVIAAAALDGSGLRAIAHGTTPPGEAPQIPW